MRPNTKIWHIVNVIHQTYCDKYMYLIVNELIFTFRPPIKEVKKKH